MITLMSVCISIARRLLYLLGVRKTQQLVCLFNIYRSILWLRSIVYCTMGGVFKSGEADEREYLILRGVVTRTELTLWFSISTNQCRFLLSQKISEYY